ncbi:hypothetical protein I5M27_10055 [Adhaeribacter sp. BT258]|uniref:Tetratricopeptide repeat-containing protein n=1 Tax=Adhaeribacter terrigena TaxID=2793070 RepID=A0ABS1C1Q4_9BACT|nr:hypothetical protein [Adhaeribacter terrigena]MBK0403329.1 hypothetical protein [Adhaeribacter terrigena]
MKELEKLVQIVTKRHQKNAPLLNFTEKKPGKELALFQAYQQGKITDPKNKKKTPDSAELRMTRARLRRKLLNHLHFLNFNDPFLKVSYRHEQECLNLIYEAHILIREGEYQISEKLLRKALKLAQESELTSSIVNSIQLLQFIYSQTGSAVRYKALAKLIPGYQELLQKEQEAETIYNTAKLEINRSVSAKKKYLPTLQSNIEHLKALWEKYKSFGLFEAYYKANIWYQELTNNFTDIVTITLEAQRMLQKKKINPKRFDDRYNKFINVYAHLRDKQFTQGLAFAAKAVDSFNRSSNNWFAFMENYFLLAMHAGNYNEATKLIEEVYNNPFFQKINRAAQERWQLYRAYLYFIFPDGHLKRQFSYQSFVIAVPEYSKDKQGFNVAILILQYLHYLKSKEVEALLYRIESLKKYSGRHLKDNFSLRTQYFFKLLMLVVKEDLDPVKVRRKGRALADKLADTPAPGDAYAEIEIIPYEALWEQILRILQEK